MERPEFVDDTPEEREDAISSIISYLGLASIGELRWIDRYLKRIFVEQLKVSNKSENNIYEKKKREIQELLNKYEGLAKDLANIQEEKSVIESELEKVETQKNIIEVEKNSLADELARIGRLYEEMTGEKAGEEDIQQLLGIYITLMEKVFSGRAHFKILSLLQGEKSELFRDEIVKSTGISDITIRRAIGDLVRAGFITYNEETTMVKSCKDISSLK